MAEPIRVGKLLTSLPGLADRLAEARLVSTWPALAGAAGARSRAEGVDEGVLQIAVDSSGWLHRLTLEEPLLIARCREIAAIRGIRFRLAPLPGPAGAMGAKIEGEVRS
jgi:predicted nucleic acid-binding Zn ribbon protein